MDERTIHSYIADTSTCSCIRGSFSAGMTGWLSDHERAIHRRIFEGRLAAWRFVLRELRGHLAGELHHLAIDAMIVDGLDERVVDVWHPDLTLRERAILEPMLKLLDDDYNGSFTVDNAVHDIESSFARLRHSNGSHDLTIGEGLA